MKFLFLLLGLSLSIGSFANGNEVIKTFTIDAFNADYLVFDNQLMIGKKNDKIKFI